MPALSSAGAAPLLTAGAPPVDFVADLVPPDGLRPLLPRIHRRSAPPKVLPPAVPHHCSLADVLPLAEPDISRRWSRTGLTGTGFTGTGLTEGLAVPVGAGRTGAVRVDLKADGPHLLVAGTTGSGKSEFLRTLAAGLAASHPPDRVNLLFIDFKGGSGLGPLTGLPHCVGMVTDLGGAEIERTLVSLRAEVRRREELLAEVGAPDLAAYELSPAAGQPMPYLVIVVDEFRVLVDEAPGALAELMRIAAIGRSLGIHLVLATQRPQGALNADIRANVTTCVALRVQSGLESFDIMGSGLAAAIPIARPGRAFLIRGSQAPVEFQTATLTPATATRTNGAVTVRTAADELARTRPQSSSGLQDRGLPHRRGSLCLQRGPDAGAGCGAAHRRHVRLWRAFGGRPAPATGGRSAAVRVAVSGTRARGPGPDSAGTGGPAGTPKRLRAELESCSARASGPRIRRSRRRGPEPRRRPAPGRQTWSRTFTYSTPPPSSAPPRRQPGSVRWPACMNSAGRHGCCSASPRKSTSRLSMPGAGPQPRLVLVLSGWGAWVSAFRSGPLAWAEDLLHDIVRDGARAGVTVIVSGERELVTARFFAGLPNRIFFPAGSTEEDRLAWPRLPALEPVSGRVAVFGPFVPSPLPTGHAAQLLEPCVGGERSRADGAVSTRPFRIEALPSFVTVDEVLAQSAGPGPGQRVTRAARCRARSRAGWRAWPGFGCLGADWSLRRRTPAA